MYLFIFSRIFKHYGAQLDDITQYDDAIVTVSFLLLYYITLFCIITKNLELIATPFALCTSFSESVIVVLPPGGETVEVVMLSVAWTSEHNLPANKFG